MNSKGRSFAVIREEIEIVEVGSGGGGGGVGRTYGYDDGGGEEEGGETCVGGDEVSELGDDEGSGMCSVGGDGEGVVVEDGDLIDVQERERSLIDIGGGGA